MTAQELLLKLDEISADATMEDVHELLAECGFELTVLEEPWDVLFYYHRAWGERLTFPIESTSIPRSKLDGILSLLRSRLSQESAL